MKHGIVKGGPLRSDARTAINSPEDLTRVTFPADPSFTHTPTNCEGSIFDVHRYLAPVDPFGRILQR